jgi:hypothetical protein
LAVLSAHFDRIQVQTLFLKLLVADRMNVSRSGLLLCMAYKRAAESDAVPDETADPQTRYAFQFRAYWFVLVQTEGGDIDTPPVPGFDIDSPLHALNITRTPFDEMSGNIQGFATGPEIAVNPLAALPHKTAFHEIAHYSGAHNLRKGH